MSRIRKPTSSVLSGGGDVVLPGVRRPSAETTRWDVNEVLCVRVRVWGWVGLWGGGVRVDTWRGEGKVCLFLCVCVCIVCVVLLFSMCVYVCMHSQANTRICIDFHTCLYLLNIFHSDFVHVKKYQLLFLSPMLPRLKPILKKSLFNIVLNNTNE